MQSEKSSSAGGSRAHSISERQCGIGRDEYRIEVVRIAALPLPCTGARSGEDHTDLGEETMRRLRAADYEVVLPDVNLPALIGPKYASRFDTQ
jgi:hypothetical protein